MNPSAMLTTFVAGLLLGGSLADSGFGDFLAIVGGATGAGAGLGSVFAWMLDYEPRWGAGAGYGSAVGFGVGLILAIIDTGLS